MVCLRKIWCGAVGGRAHATAGRSTQGSLSRAAACAASAAHLVAAAGTKVVRRARRHLNTPFLLSGYCRWRGFWCDIGYALQHRQRCYKDDVVTPLLAWTCDKCGKVGTEALIIGMTITQPCRTSRAQPLHTAALGHMSKSKPQSFICRLRMVRNWQPLLAVLLGAELVEREAFERNALLQLGEALLHALASENSNKRCDTRDE